MVFETQLARTCLPTKLLRPRTSRLLGARPAGGSADCKSEMRNKEHKQTKYKGLEESSQKDLWTDWTEVFEKPS